MVWFPPRPPFRRGQGRENGEQVVECSKNVLFAYGGTLLHMRKNEMLKSSVIGNLGSEPDMKYSANGAPFLRFNVASNGRVRDEAGNWKDETTWVRVTVFGQRAETLSQHLHKGTRVFCDGRLEARPWTGQNGQLNAGLELIATDVEFMSTRNEDGGQQARPAQRNTADVPF